MTVYRALLHLFPASFRAEYGREMCSVFARRRRDAGNPFLVLALWVETFFDVLVNATGVHVNILRHDLKYAARTFSRAPAFTLTAVGVAALGIGATTAAFTMIDHVLLRPLPFPDQERLVKMFEDHGANGKQWDLSPANYRDWKNMSRSFENMGAYWGGVSMNMVGKGQPQRIEGAAVTAELFPTLGVQPWLGRYFSASDDRDGAPGTIVLSYSMWRGQFGGDPAVLGRKVLLDDAGYTVIGVMPENFNFPTRDTQLWTAMRFAPDAFADRTDYWVYAIARLKRGVTLEKSQAEMSAITSQLARAYPKELNHTSATVIELRDQVTDQSRILLKALLGAAFCVLLIACTNLANLLLARALTRRKELAVRAAMGAGRERLVRQMLTESLLIAGAGGALGVLIAYLVLPLLARLVPVTLPIAQVPSIDLRVLLVAAALTFATGIGFGVIPALRVCRRDDAGGLREGSRSGVGGRRERLRSALVIAEVAGSVVLLVSCGLLIQALWRIQAIDPGFRAEHVLTLRTSLAIPKYERRPVREQFYQRVLSEARQLPGVTGAAYTSFLPMAWGGGIWPVEIQGRPQEKSMRQTASLRFITPGYFNVLGIPLLTGRDVQDSDSFDRRPFVALVSDSFVRRYFAGENPLGRHFNFGNDDRIIIGVVGNVLVRGLERTSEPQVYLSYKQHGEVGPFYSPKDLAIRASGNPAELAPALRRIIHEADPEQPVSDLQLLTDIVALQTAPRVVQVRVLGAFAFIAFLLAAIGIHGLLSFTVSNRTQEIGVRIALGARWSDIVPLTVRDAAVLSAIGIALGVAGAYAAGRALQALLAGVQPGDLTTFGAAVALVCLMTIAGSLVPTIRAVRVDPTTAIRAE